MIMDAVMKYIEIMCFERNDLSLSLHINEQPKKIKQQDAMLCNDANPRPNVKNSWRGEMAKQKS